MFHIIHFFFNHLRIRRTTTDGIFSLKQVIEKRVEFNLETHLAFIDLVKAFDNVSRQILWQIMKRRGYPQHLIGVLESIYKETKIVILIGDRITRSEYVNQGVRQGCSLSPTLYNIYMDDAIRRWKQQAPLGIKIAQESYLNTILYADDQVIIQSSEDDLQKSVFLLKNIGKEYNMKISTRKTKVMAFAGKDPVRSKIVLDNRILEQVSHFTYLGCDVSYEKDKEILRRVSRFQTVCGFINRTFRRRVRKDTQARLYDVMAVPLLLYGCESWVLRSAQLRKVEAAEMRFLRGMRGCSLRDHIRSSDIRRELGREETILEKMYRYRSKWVDHVERMAEERVAVRSLNYRPTGRRSVGRPRKRWCEAGTGVAPNP